MDDEQHDEVCSIVNSIEKTHKDELEKVFGEGESIREMWKIDSQSTFKMTRKKHACPFMYI